MIRNIPTFPIYPSLPFGNQKLVCGYVCESVSVLQVSSLVSLFYKLHIK